MNELLIKAKADNKIRTKEKNEELPYDYHEIFATSLDILKVEFLLEYHMKSIDIYIKVYSLIFPSISHTLSLHKIQEQSNVAKKSAFQSESPAVSSAFPSSHK